jgi:uncharacterized protein
MNQNVVGWFEIYVSDMERARQFYEAVFQLPLEAMAIPVGNEGVDMLAFPTSASAPGAGGALVKMKGYGPAASATIIYFVSDDCAQELSRVVAAGGVVVQPKQSIGEYGFMGLFKDSEGNTIGVHSIK